MKEKNIFGSSFKILNACHTKTILEHTINHSHITIYVLGILHETRFWTSYGFFPLWQHQHTDERSPQMRSQQDQDGHNCDSSGLGTHASEGKIGLGSDLA